ncbi:hypothetical protein BKA66DRAFT_598916 [Pyrenochaeta sp. MPI-SDFR-AT-0127]|nr:hypothetical protein BKA66DRAFT_598916 [Pyrenochaeta sp. MPI-SDFR-AT-0127]
MSSDRCFHSLSNFSSEDRTVISCFGRGPSIPVPHSLVHKAFESIAEANPNALAAKIGSSTLTYRQLDIAANRLAHYLIDSGLQPRQRVCLIVQRSFEMLIGLLAILKAGCQYVPVDGGVTSDHALNHILTDTNARFTLCLPKFFERVERFAGRDAIIFPVSMDVAAFYPSVKPEVRMSPRDGVYAIYTSGSTGTPKGVDVSHSSVANALLLEPAKLGITVGMNVAQVLNIAFDMGAWEILACLMNGGTLHMRGSDWEATLREIDVLISTPSILSRFKRSSFMNIKTVVTGGEPCPQILADEWANGSCFYNVCGPTEISVLNTAHRHTSGTPLSIGKPLPNTTCYILDDDERPVPLGEKGTMWVGGSGVSRGYINLPELTSKRYKPDKFLQDGSRMFNTGDVVRWRQDGSLEMFGRTDNQVKIKGFRVELDGVTEMIETFTGIERAAAILIDNSLYAFYESTSPVDESDVDAFVRTQLPYYSVPAKWTHVASFPLTSNGKVDKRKLKAMVVPQIKADSVADTASLAKSHASSGTALAILQPVLHTMKTHKDLEKGTIFITRLSSNFTDMSLKRSVVELPETLPPKMGFHGLRWLRHRAFILYRRFFSIVILANLAAAFILLYRKIKDNRYILADLATASAANLCMAVLMRSEPVVNLLFTIFCSVPTSFPLVIRRHCARIFHVGGIHSGCAIAAVAWHAIFAVGASLELAKPLQLRCISLPPTVIAYVALVIFLAMGSTSHPTFRAKYHNAWEMTHRFGGWTCLILLWIQVMLATKDLNPNIAASKAYAQSPPMWLIVIATLAIIFPWLYLRKVAVRPEVLSNHAVRLWFDYTTPPVGTGVRLAERPLVDWHGFATITNPSGKGFSLIVSRAGDFTGSTIERPPTHIYVRGIPACGVLRIATLFKSVVLVATGSGIGPCLSVILARKVPCRILWTAPNPEQTFGQEIVDSVKSSDPDAVIWNTRTHGKPNTSLMAYQLWKESGAEAVCVISNKKFTTKIVYDLEARGIPAYGAIFDS